MNIEGILKAAVEKKQKAQLNKDRSEILQTIGRDITNALTPVLTEIAKKSSVSADGVVEAIERGVERGFKNFKFPEPNINVQVPDIIVPDIQFPKIPAPQVNYTPPAIHIPNIEMPKEMDIKGWVQLQGVDLGHPLPVQLRDASGRPVNLLENLTTIIGGGGGGKHDFFTIKGYSQSAFAEIMNPDGRVKVEMPAGAAGLTDIELRAAHLDVLQLSGSIDSVYVTGIFNSTAADVINADNRLRVSTEPGAAGLTDTELRASSVPVAQVSGANWSVEATISGTPTVNVGTFPDNEPFNLNQLAGDVPAKGTELSPGFLRVVHATDVGVTTSATIVAAIPAGTNNIGDVDVLTLPALPAGTNNIGDIDVLSIAAGNNNIGDVDVNQITSPWVVTKVTGATATTAKVTIGADASTEIVPTASERKSVIITHESSNTLYIATGAASSINSFPLVANQVIGFDDYHGGLQGRLSDDGAAAKGTVEVKFIEV